MAKKASSTSDNKIDLSSILSSADLKSRDWWDTLTIDQQRTFSSWLYMRYMSSVSGQLDLVAFYIQSVNETVNKHFNAIKNHKQLQYLLMTAASPGIGVVRHNWMPALKGMKSNKKHKLLQELWPNLNDAELELVATNNSDDDIKQYLMDLGWSDKQINGAFKPTEENEY